MNTDDILGGGFAEVRDGVTITPVIRPTAKKKRRRDEPQDGRPKRPQADNNN